MVKHISSGSSFEEAFGYSRAVIDGDMIYVAGTTGYDYKSMAIPEDVAEQTINILATIAKTLEKAGSSLDDVVRMRCYLCSVEDLETIQPLIAKAFDKARPAATLVVASLIRPEMKIEIEVTARMGAYIS